MEKSKLYTIECRTGCSCCSNENHHRGPWKTREEAEMKVAIYKSMPLLASQYSSTGHYHISERECEILPDGRIICDDRILQGFLEDNVELDEEICQEWY